MSDPSRKKLEDLPYIVRLVSRKRSPRKSSQVDTPEDEGTFCVYCSRPSCKGCPLRFEEKVTLRDILDKAKITTSPNYYYEDARNNSSARRKDKKKSKKPLSVTPDDNDEFELLVQFNEKKCWGLISSLNRFDFFENSNFKNNTDPEENISAADGVSIHDCIR